MNREVLKIKKTLEKETPQEKKWAKLLDKEGLHPREEVIERWVKMPMTFDEDEERSMDQHFNVCKACEKVRDNTFPLLREAS